MPRRESNANRPTKRGKRTRSDGQKRSKKQQKRVDDYLGATRVPGSGAPICQAGDSRHHAFLQENKTTKGLHADRHATKHLGIYIEGSWLIKVTDEARSRGLDPVLCFTVESMLGKVTDSGFPVEDTWVAMPISVFRERIKDDEGIF